MRRAQSAAAEKGSSSSSLQAPERKQLKKLERAEDDEERVPLAASEILDPAFAAELRRKYAGSPGKARQPCP